MDFPVSEIKHLIRLLLAFAGKGLTDPGGLGIRWTVAISLLGLGHGYGVF